MQNKQTTQKYDPDNFADGSINPQQLASNDSGALTILATELESLANGESQQLHLQQEAGMCRVRSRVNGLLNESKHPSSHLIDDLLSELSLKFAESFGKQTVRLPLLTDVHNLELNYYQTAHGQSLTIVVCFGRTPSTLDQTSLKPESIEKIRSTLSDAPNGITLFVCNELQTLRNTYYAMLNEANDMEHKVVSLESKIDAELPRVNQIELNKNTDIPKLIPLCTEHADRVFINTGNIANIDQRLIKTLHESAINTNLCIGGSSVAQVLKQFASIQPPHSSTNPYLNRVIELQATRLICPHCADFSCVNDRDINWLKSNTVIEKDLQHQAFNTANGCARCNNTGCEGSITLMSAYDINMELLSSIDTATSKEISASLQSLQGKSSVRYQHEVLAREGAVRFEDFRRS